MGRTVRGGKCSCDIEYSALPSQRRFHSSPARFKGFSGPIGSGKSQALCHEAIKLTYLNPGRKGLIGAPTYPMLRDATQTALLRILEGNEIPYTLLKSENTLLMRDTGSQILLRSLEEYERLRGTNLAWFGVDELTYAHREAWLRLEGRLRDPAAASLCGFAVWTPKGHDWVYERFLSDPPDGYETVVAKPMENKHILDKIPDFYDRLEKSYDDKFFRQEVLGEYLNVTEGRVYSAFEREEHIQATELDEELPLLWAFDFNVDPMCCVIGQRDGDMIYVLDEIVLRRSSTAEACEEFLNRYPNHTAGLRLYGDASGNSRSSKTDETDYEVVRRQLRDSRYAGTIEQVPRKNPAIRDRVGAVNARLKSADGEIHVLIHPRCKELIRDFEEMVYKEDSSAVDKEKDKSRSHLSDAFGYLIWQEINGKVTRPKPVSKPLF
jgi:terminase large subunit-like protein